MKRLLLALVPWMAMTSAVRAQTPADVVFTHMGVVNERCLRLDDECFVPLTFLDSVGWTYTQRGETIDLAPKISACGSILRVFKEGDGSTPVALDKLGGDSSWTATIWSCLLL